MVMNRNNSYFNKGRNKSESNIINDFSFEIPSFPPMITHDAVISRMNVQGFRCGYGSYARAGIQFQSPYAYPIGFIFATLLQYATIIYASPDGTCNGTS